MMAKHFAKSKWFVVFLLLSLVLVSNTSWASQEVADEAIMDDYTAEAELHAEKALHAARDKHLNEAAKHAEMALKAGQKATQLSKDKDTSPDTQKSFEEVLRALQNSVNLAREGKGEDTEKATTEALLGLRPREVCHGDGCTPAACGCAASYTKCDRFHPTRKCTPYGCACYCM